jgi:hypothetical protein
MMRFLFVFFLTLNAAAQTPTQFRSAAPLTLANTTALHRAPLPFEAYREGRPDLADIRVFNSQGDAVPIAFAGDPEPRKEALPLVDLPMFPVSTLATAPGGRGSEVTVRTQDGTLVSIRGKQGAPAATAKVAAILLDASQLEEPLKSLEFEWKAAPGTQIVRVRVEGSDDLKAWGAIASGPLVRLESGGRELSQPKVEFPPRKVKYLRLTWDAAGFVVQRVRAEREPKVQPAPRATRNATATAGEKPGDWVYDLGARLPVEAFRLVPTTPNDVVAATILTRNDPKEPWRLLASAPFYRLDLEGAEKQSPPVEIGRRPARYWLARFPERAPNAAPPTLEAHWRPAQVVFVTHGAAPFTLAFGNPQATRVALPIQNLLPEYQALGEMKLPEAKVGAVTSGPEPSRWEQLRAEANPKRITLWAILVLAVAVLGFFAWRLMRQK